MNYSFNIEIATEYGVTEAIIIENIAFWTHKNIANGTNQHDGRYWVYNSVKAWGELFPFWGSAAIVNALKRLEDQGVIATGNYNKSTYDRTKWYSLDESLFSLHYCISRKDKMEDTKEQNGFVNKPNGFVQIDEPIPVIIPVVVPVIETKEATPPVKDDTVPKKRFIQPTQLEVGEYMSEVGIIEFEQRAHQFVNYYIARGWKLSKGQPMVDWKATVQTWKHNKSPSNVTPFQEKIVKRKIL